MQWNEPLPVEEEEVFKDGPRCHVFRMKRTKQLSPPLVNFKMNWDSNSGQSESHADALVKSFKAEILSALFKWKDQLYLCS